MAPPAIRPIKWQKLEKFFKNHGFKRVRITGSHVVLEKEGCPRPVIIPKYSEVGLDIIMSNLRTAGISRAEYLKSV